MTAARATYAVTTFEEGNWHTRRFARMATARSFARREMLRMRIGLFVIRTNPDLTCDQMIDADRVNDIRWRAYP